MASVVQRRQLRSEFEVFTHTSTNGGRHRELGNRQPGRPRQTVIRLLTPFNELLEPRRQELRYVLASVLRDEALRAVLAWRNHTPYPWRRNEAETRVRGYLQGVNLTNAAAKVSSHPMKLYQLTAGKIDDVMEFLHTSNQEIDMLEIEWSFIFDDRTLLMGGASLVKPPRWAPKRYIETWKSHVTDEGSTL